MTLSWFIVFKNFNQLWSVLKEEHVI